VKGAGAGTREVLRRVRAEARAFDVRTLVRTVVEKYREQDLLTYASAISFQVFFALIPMLLFALGLIGFLSLDAAWAKDIAPEIKPHVSRPMFEVIDDTVNQVLGSKAVFWVTFGGVIAVWEISGAMSLAQTSDSDRKPISPSANSSSGISAKKTWNEIALA